MRPLRVVVADAGTMSRVELITLSERAGFDIVAEATEWDGVSDLVDTRSADLVLVAGPPEFARGVSVFGGTVATAIVAPDALAAKEYADCGAFAILTPQLEPEIASAIATTAVARASDLRAARKEAEQLRGLLETRKLVERAKGVLMRRLEISEDVAYRRMQRASQDENRKMGDIAESILSAERLYGTGDGNGNGEQP